MGKLAEQEKKLEELDTNFALKQAPEAIQWIEIQPKSPLLFGLMTDPKAPFCRLPSSAAERLNRFAYEMYTSASGGRLHFVTDSHCVAVRVELGKRFVFSHAPYLCTAGMDVYVRQQDTWRFAGALIPQDRDADCYEASVVLPEGEKLREVLVNMPMYAQVKSLRLGFDAQSHVLSPRPVRDRSQIVFYGSSITQGGCAPRPGNNYPAILSRRLDCDFWNLGFSNGARGEDAIVDYLCSLPMDVLVCDYDHNADTLEELEKTHFRFYERFRVSRPHVPIVFSSAPFAHPSQEFLLRRELIMKNVQQARNNGDILVAFVDGMAVFPPQQQEECSVDGIHPNAFGMSCMADAYELPLRRFLQK